MNAIDSRDVQSLMTRAIVQDIKPEAEGVLTMELVPDGEAEWPAGDAGAHIDVELPNGTVRHYPALLPIISRSCLGMKTRSLASIN